MATFFFRFTLIPFLSFALRRGSRSLSVLAVLFLLTAARSEAESQVPTWLPHYDLDIQLQTEEHQVIVRERVTWTNRHQRPADTVVFNAHAHYSIPDKDVGLIAKMLEILRLSPSEAMDFNGPPLDVQKVCVVGDAKTPDTELSFHYQEGNDTALEVKLPGPIHQAQTVTLELSFKLRLPPKQGRWGQWQGVTFLAQWLPVLAYYDDCGWQPTPFVPWHQPFFNEAGIYTARVTYPCSQKLGCSGSVRKCEDLGNGWHRAYIEAAPVRDFALFCSARFQEFCDHAGPVRVRVLAFPEHTFYAEEMLRTACATLPAYERWFGAYPYTEFTVVESYFGWNGNECGGLVMIDARIFGMPHLARNYVNHLLMHEICHQWWYNVVGTNGYAETWMDEGLATYYSHRLFNEMAGKNNALLTYPAGFEWLPNIYREDYRHYGLYGTLGRGEESPSVQDLPKFGHLVNLTSMTYDRGGKIVGMIEARLGEAAMFDFMHRVYHKYQFRILRVADFQHELEAYTGCSWEEFFGNWLYGKGMSDWCLDKVELQRWSAGDDRWCRTRTRRCFLPECCTAKGKCDFLTALGRGKAEAQQPCRAVVYVRQKGECNEPAVLGFCLDGGEHFQVRVPLLPHVPLLQLEDWSARVDALADNRFRVEVVLPCEPTQIAVDPDQVLLDREPANNYWRPRVRLRVTPVYFQLDETDLTNSYDRVNVIAGPWLFGATYDDPWYTRSSMAGLRVGMYRTQQYSGGAYLAYRTNDRNIIAGLDGLIDHWPWSKTQVGFNVERSLVTLDRDQTECSRGVFFARYVMMYGDSLYLPPFEYLEAFSAVQNRCLPFPEKQIAGADLFDQQTVAGLHYHKYLLTPYWDPEGGVALDATYQEGLPIFGESRSFHQVIGQVSLVKSMPDPLHWLRDTPRLNWLADTRWAARLYAAAALPDDGQFFTLGGGEQFRGFDLSERQGSVVWIGSLEWRVPLRKGLTWDCCDHVAGLRNIYGALFYDVGDAYLQGHSLGPVAHAVGAGLRLDIAWFGLIERTMLRLDVAQTVNVNSPVQFWLGVHHPF